MTDYKTWNTQRPGETLEQFDQRLRMGSLAYTHMIVNRSLSEEDIAHMMVESDLQVSRLADVVERIREALED